MAIGAALAFRLSAKLGLCPQADADRLIAHLKATGLPSAIADIPGLRPAPEALIAAMAHDKKVKDSKLIFVLARRIGETFVTGDVPVETVLEIVS